MISLCPHVSLVRIAHVEKEGMEFYDVCTLILQCRAKSIYARKYMETRDLYILLLLSQTKVYM